jgi:hypothetical protein
MTNELIEFSSVNTTRRCRPRLPLPSRERRLEGASTSAIIDEAFAGFTRTDGPESQRPDRTATPNAENLATGIMREAVRNLGPVKKELVANLAMQLKALDSQREQLTRLLHNIDASLFAD